MLATELSPAQLQALADGQRAFFESGATRAYEFRREQLRRFRTALVRSEARIMAALKADLSKPDMEAYGAEVAFLYAEIDHALRHLKSWMKPRRVPSPLMLKPSASYLLREPYGVALIIGPWNYPLRLVLAPLVGAIAAGNCAVVKPSEFAPATGGVIAELLGEVFPAHYVAAVQGDAGVGQALLDLRWDYIFFTGSTAVGKLVAQSAAVHLTPTTLELGGKSPCIVDRDANLDLAAKRVVFGKFFNAGQTCVAPDYLLVHEGVKDALLERVRHHITASLSAQPAQSPDFARIINARHFDRLERLLASGQAVVGGQVDRARRYIAPTVLDGVTLDDPVMQEEIFGPILPVLTYRTLDDAISLVRSRPRPLALYLFTSSPVTEERVMAELSFGGGCINDTLMHFISAYLPAGGVGESGTGGYHGRFGFEAFTHVKGVVKTPTWIDLPLRYPPYGKKLAFFKRLFK